MSISALFGYISMIHFSPHKHRGFQDAFVIKRERLLTPASKTFGAFSCNATHFNVARGLNAK